MKATSGIGDDPGATRVVHDQDGQLVRVLRFLPLILDPQAVLPIHRSQKVQVVVVSTLGPGEDGSCKGFGIEAIASAVEGEDEGTRQGPWRWRWGIILAFGTMIASVPAAIPAPSRTLLAISIRATFSVAISTRGISFGGSRTDLDPTILPPYPRNILSVIRKPRYSYSFPVVVMTTAFPFCSRLP